jgi:hypothetical protein
MQIPSPEQASLIEVLGYYLGCKLGSLKDQMLPEQGS